MKSSCSLFFLLCMSLLITGCRPKNFADYRLMEHIEENRIVTVDSDLELLSSLEHQRPTRGQSRRGEQNKRRLRSLFRIFQSKDNEESFLFRPPTPHKDSQIQAEEARQPGRLRLGLTFGNNALHIVDVWK